MTSRISLVLRLGTVALTAVVPLSRAASTETITYTYDAQGRLIAAISSGTINNGVQATYEHDAADNRVRVVVSGSPNPPPP